MDAEEFDATDPRDMADYWAAWKVKQQREDYRTARIVCTIANLFCKEPADAVEPADVFPSLPRSSRVPSESMLADKILSVAASLGAVSEIPADGTQTGNARD